MAEKQTLQHRLIAAQNELKAPKGQYNSFGKYKYRSAEDILEAVKPINEKHGLLLIIYDEPMIVGDRIYIKATAEITDELNEQTYKVTAYAREALSKKGMDESQITGTASSYARKYALNGLYLIDDTKDADTDEHQNQQNNQSGSKLQKKMATDKQLELVRKLISNKHATQEERNAEFTELVQTMAIPVNMTQWTSQQASAAIKRLQDEIRA